MKKYYNIFTLGSCRSHINLYTKHKFFRNFDCSHDTKAHLQWLYLLLGKMKLSDHPAAHCFCFKPKNFMSNINKIKNDLFNCDIILIEISSIKVFYDKLGFIYQMNRLEENGMRYSKQVMVRKQSEKEIYNDIIKIQKIINKPIIFQGHINLKFLTLGNTYIPNRIKIDNAIRHASKFHLIIKDIFLKKMNKNPEDSIDCRPQTKLKLGKCSIGFKGYFNDPYHFSNKGYIVLAQKFDKTINYMISKGVL